MDKNYADDHGKKKVLSSDDIIRQLPENPLSLDPSHEERVKRYLWLRTLNERKDMVEDFDSSDARNKDLEQLNAAINKVKQQLNGSQLVKRKARQKQRNEVLTRLIEKEEHDELKKLGQLGVWNKLTEVNKVLFPPKTKRDETLIKFFSKQHLLKFREAQINSPIRDWSSPELNCIQYQSG